MTHTLQTYAASGRDAALPPLEVGFRAKRAAGRRLLVAYVMAGIVPDWLTLVSAAAEAGADAIEIGLPFSDPMADGPTLQEANAQALRAGTTATTVLDQLTSAAFDVPLIVMTYANVLHNTGLEAFADRLGAAGVTGVITADLPVEHSADYRTILAERRIAGIFLAAPASPDARLETICGLSTGFVYAVSSMTTTGERSALTEEAGLIATRLRAVTDKPVIVGFGVSTPAHAAALAEYADGVVVASALMRQVLDGAGPAELATTIGALRRALDQAP